MSETKSDVKPVKKLKYHLFVCMNERPTGHPRGCCKSKGAEELLQTLKTEIAKAGIQAEIRAQKSGCLDTCEYGMSLVVYPENIWYGHVKLTDVPEIIQSHLIQGKPIDRLRIPGK
jgi:(2Fe-2S) ferredoxin